MTYAPVHWALWEADARIEAREKEGSLQFYGPDSIRNIRMGPPGHIIVGRVISSAHTGRSSDFRGGGA